MSFNILGLSPELKKAIERKGYTNPSDIQLQAIPSIIEGNDYLNNKGTYTHDILTQEALSFIKDKKEDKPFFLFSRPIFLTGPAPIARHCPADVSYKPAPL